MINENSTYTVTGKDLQELLSEKRSKAIKGVRQTLSFNAVMHQSSFIKDLESKVDSVSKQLGAEPTSITPMGAGLAHLLGMLAATSIRFCRTVYTLEEMDKLHLMEITGFPPKYEAASMVGFLRAAADYIERNKDGNVLIAMLKDERRHKMIEADQSYTISGKELMDLVEYRHQKAVRMIGKDMGKRGELLTSSLVADDFGPLEALANKLNMPEHDVALRALTAKTVIDTLVGAADMFCREVYGEDDRPFKYPVKNETDRYKPEEAREYMANVLQAASDYIRNTQGEDIIMKVLEGSLGNE